MVNVLKKIYAFPFLSAVILWLALPAPFVYVYFFISGFRQNQVRNFLYIQGKAIQFAICAASGFNKKIIKKSAPQKPSILIANHPCTYDTFVFFDFGIKNLVCIAKGWPFKIPFYGKFIKKAGYINSDNKTSEEIIKEVQDKFAQNLHIGIFPEGTRKKEIGRFRSLAFKISIETGADIIPFVIKGLEEMLPPGKYLPKQAPIKYIQLAPISPKQWTTVEAGALRMAQYVKSIIISQL
ncbi:MAG: 1-acyl-sn-glycerol-3-phosphate acyltransferase [Elusimicrobiota bacterium]|jgi:1-acyl-sn-glycerol-3-phosphate acyltransferase|nr:1-acyl-sn-glycerol-3-phosphate acyltransferase [Elusimicrobiota bacterium]